MVDDVGLGEGKSGSMDDKVAIAGVTFSFVVVSNV